ncbi:MAG TPA: STAS/SEC14 domain-containing protein [Planctomycetota bacterium]|nr:STAS/SEC14 domain-containing protein [Planctomycetota bacterium]
MLTLLPDLPEHVVGVAASGRVTAGDYEAVLAPVVEAALARRAELHLLYHLGPAFEGFTAGAVWDDAKLGLRHLAAWKRIAVVTDVEWLRNAVRAFGVFVPCPVRVFANAELPRAREWVTAERS